MKPQPALAEDRIMTSKETFDYVASVERAVKAAVEEEREACAKIADFYRDIPSKIEAQVVTEADYRKGVNYTAKGIAADIRARSQS